MSPGTSDDDLPFAIAFPLHFARDPSLAEGARVDNVIFAAYQLMRLTAVLLLADYFDQGVTAAQLVAPIRGLRMPHWSEWSVLCDRLCDFWESKLDARPVRPARFEAIVRGWRAVNPSRRVSGGPFAPWIEDLRTERGEPVSSANHAIQVLRNARAHRLGTRLGAGDDAATLARFLPLVEAMVGAVFGGVEITLYRRVRVEEGVVWGFALRGAHPDRRFAETVLPVSDAVFTDCGTDAVAVCDGVAVPLHPLVGPEPDTPEGRSPVDGMREELLVLDQVQRDRVVLLGVVRPVWSRAWFPALQRRLARFAVELGHAPRDAKPWTLGGWARAHALDRVAEHRRIGKYVPACYVVRGDIEERLEGWAQDARGAALLLVGNAGAGKTSLLTRLVERLCQPEDAGAVPSGAPALRDALSRYLAGRGAEDIVLFLSGRVSYASDRALSGAEVLRNAVLGAGGVLPPSASDDDTQDLARFVARIESLRAGDTHRDRRLWIVLDAINEADRFTDLIDALANQAPALAARPWLRLVVSIREGAYDELQRRHERGLKAGAWFLGDPSAWAHFEDSRGAQQPYLFVRGFTEEEAARAYEQRQAAQPDRACPVEYASLDATLREQLRSPLALHVFHETFAGEGAVPALDASGLFDAYLDALVRDLPGLGEWLAELGATMRASRRPELAIATADAWKERYWSRPEVRAAQQVARLDPVEEMVSASLLLRPSRELDGGETRAYTFVHERLAEQVLLRAMRAAADAPREPSDWLRYYMAEAAKADDRFETMASALGAFVRGCVRLGDGATLGVIFSGDDEGLRRRLGAEVIRAMEPVAQRGASGHEQCGTLVRTMLGVAGARYAQRVLWDLEDGYEWLVKGGNLELRERVVRAVGESLAARVKGQPDFDPGLFRDLSISHERIGGVLLAQGDGAGALRAFRESLTIAERLAQTDPRNTEWQRDLSVSHNKIGDVLLAQGDGAGALRAFRESLTIAERLAQTDPRNTEWQRDLSISHERIGGVLLAQGDGAGALRAFRESFTIRERLAQTDPRNTEWQRDLSISHERIGGVLLAQGDGAGALRAFRESFTIRERLAQTDPRNTEWQRDLSISHERIAVIHLNDGKLDRAVCEFNEAISIWSTLRQLDPSNADWQAGAAVPLYHLAAIHERRGESDAAATCRAQAIALLRPLYDQGKLTAARARLFERLRSGEPTAMTLRPAAALGAGRSWTIAAVFVVAVAWLLRHGC